MSEVPQGPDKTPTPIRLDVAKKPNIFSRIFRRGPSVPTPEEIEARRASLEQWRDNVKMMRSPETGTLDDLQIEKANAALSKLPPKKGEAA